MTDLEIAPVSTALDFTQAAVVLGEQRAWAERLLGRELSDVQPTAREEYARLADFYRPPDGQLLLARLRREPVGVVGVRRLEGAVGEGKRLYVRRSARGFGIGRRLADELPLLARRLGFRSLCVETSPQRTPESYELCRRLGFHETTARVRIELHGFVAMQLAL